MTVVEQMSYYQNLYNIAMHSVLATLEIARCNDDLTQYLNKPEENPWHNITKQNKQYEWDI